MAKSSNAKRSGKGENQDPAIYLVTYVLEFITGIIVYLAFSEGDRRLKFHAMQATLIGVISIFVSVIFGFILPPLGSLLIFLIWLYSMYIGLEAYNGREVEVPFITSYLKSHPDFKKV